MIPARLQLKNFLSYGESVPPLDFTGLRLVCLSGDNGNGKTALLDAMTWALFGQTRAKTEDNIIRTGQTDVRVTLDFFVDSTKYRVDRRRGKRGGASWELQIWQEDGTLRSLTGDNSNETKAKIQSLLRMDYDTFLASGYLAQGRADTFARAGITERKRILADILDLSRYDRLEEMAKDKRKEAEARETEADRELRSIDAQLRDEDGCHIQLEATLKRQAEALLHIDGLRVEAERVAASVAAAQEQHEKAEEAEQNIADRQADNAADYRALQSVEAQIEAANRLYARREQIEDEYLRWVWLNQQQGPLQEDFSRFLAFQREVGILDNQIEEARRTIDNERYRAQCEVENLTREAADIAKMQRETMRLTAIIGEFGDIEAQRVEVETRQSAAGDELLSLKTENGTLTAQIKALQKRVEALQSSDAPACDYCGLPLPPARRGQNIRETQAEVATLQANLAVVTAQGRRVKSEVDGLKLEAERVQAHFREVARVQTLLAQAEQQLFRHEEAAKGLPGRTVYLQSLEAKLNSRDYAHDAHEKRLKIAAQMERLERAGEALRDVQNELGRYAGIERSKVELENAQKILATEPERAETLRATIAKREAQIEKGKIYLMKCRQRAADLPQLQHTQNDLTYQIRQADETLRRADREIGDLESRLKGFTTLRGQREQREEERVKAARDKDIYKELAGAFGKKGVQHLIIETMLPEIEKNANELLQSMTSGAMSIQLLTQRDGKTKKAETIETLDIIISDEMGERPYEMFSGGEAFRINLALRVALSKLLARRAGAPLQTLFLDEGFGTQDPRGREAIVDAITNLSEQFPLILVITHVEELKEAFPNRIEVTKGAGGSTFVVQ